MPPPLARSVRALLTLGAALVLASCDLPAAQVPAVPVNPLRAEPAAPAAKPAMTGKFRVAYRAVDDSTYARWQNDFRDARFLEDVAEWLNGWIALPHDVTIGFDRCGEPNAYYHPETRTVSLCYELVADLDDALAADGDEEGAQAVSDALLFTTLHEVGHALVDVLDIPIAGREEDAVDQLAAVMLVDGSDEGSEAAVNGAAGLATDDEELDTLAFADEHALGSQRFYNVLCLVYGQHPQGYAGWVTDGTLPGERAAGCVEEYAHVSRSWDRLLEPYLKD
ncbi:MAG TPA: DUF4344 domain-containing metallopeptidase [Longimicrobium sp.]|jgi:hypothetical protein